MGETAAGGGRRPGPANSGPAIALTALLVSIAETVSSGALHPVPGSHTRPRLEQAAGPEVTIEWAAEQQALVQALQPIGNDTRAKPLVRRFRGEIQRTDVTLRQARQALKQQSTDPRTLSRLTKRLKQHRIAINRLQDELAELERERETVRNERQLVSSQFENANQKATQYANMLSSILKTMSEMATGVVRNLR
jgi:hypothetical protein